MKALSISQPWAWAICHAGKRIENRDWKPPKWIIGQTIAIHAAKSWNGTQAVDFINQAMYLEWERTNDPALYNFTCPPKRDQHTAGAIVATAKITDVFTSNDIREVVAHQEDWFMGEYGWFLTSVKRLEQPIPCRGALGLWELQPDVLKALRGEWAMQNMPRIPN